ncbi:MAG TPA: hypothetical protein VF753_10430 [Terriglobales bacterium]
MNLSLARPWVADAALPLLIFTIPAVILMLIPTVLLEGIILKLSLRLGWMQALKASLIANAASTVAGVPLATLLSYGANMALSPWIRQVVLRGRHWQSPTGDALMALANSAYISAYVGEAPWLLPVALLIILVPAYFISWAVENWIVGAVLRRGADVIEPAADRINCTVRRANFLSYSLLYVLAATILIRSQFSALLR